MSTLRHHLFDTAIGRCGLAWSDAGLRALALPEASDGDTLAALLRACPGAEAAAPEELAPETWVGAAVAEITALLGGETPTLLQLPLDLADVGPFYRRVYDEARRIPPGHTKSYGEIARALGQPGASRAVGQALGRNPLPIVVPCHRVLAAGGRPGGFSAPGGLITKRRLLEIEGALPGDQPDLFATR
ncbi:methylated-DNA--[protein]-cysteine S-methyltransferase [Aquibaculum sediminis]|uniref:methylated-DNA--[protein]-cysteine S-methyltransferase n=1 Tax=Aquibaculum sediminis TaxID=3231907 RepID=UPI0034541D65